MKISLIILTALTLVASTASATEAEGEYVPGLANSRSPTTRLLKRSLCNTFGGCGAKRSIAPNFGAYGISDESSDERRYEADARMISEILDDILEHLRRDQNYKQGKYVMYVPKRTRAGPNLIQRFSPDEAPNSNRQHSIQANELEELRIN